MYVLIFDFVVGIGSTKISSLINPEYIVHTLGNIIYMVYIKSETTFSNLTYLELYTSLQECFDKLVIYHEICSDLFICNYMIVKE